MIVETKIFPNSLKVTIYKEKEVTETINLSTESFSEFSETENLDGAVNFIGNSLPYHLTPSEITELTIALEDDICILTNEK